LIPQGEGNSMSSGSEIRQRQQRLPVRCSAEELAELRATAETEGFSSVGELVRARCLRKTRAPRVSSVDRQLLARTLGQLGKYGSNLNQLAHVANMNERPIVEDQLHQLAAEIREVSSAVLEALGRGRQR
jgi:hypothetical protein